MMEGAWCSGEVAISTASADAGRNGEPLRSAAAALARGAVVAEVGSSEVAFIVEVEGHGAASSILSWHGARWPVVLGAVPGPWWHLGAVASAVLHPRVRIGGQGGLVQKPGPCWGQFRAGSHP